MAMPRGFGKSSLCLAACLWAVMIGRSRFVMYVGATDAKANERLEALKNMLRWHSLAKLYPEACYPFVHLEGESRKAAGQRYQGEKTNIWHGSGELVFAEIPGSKASGARIKAEGLTSSNLRGSLDTSPEEELLRPDLLFIDDPQTEESAASVSQTRSRLAIIKNGLLGMEGQTKMGVIGLVTVIQSGDLADTLLQDPYWIRIRTKALYEFPDTAAMKLWGEYGALCRSEGKGKATEYYTTHRAAMDSGCVVAWPEKFQSDEISAVQFCLHVFTEDEFYFYSELQNEPKAIQTKTIKLKPADILAKLNGLPRGIVPLEATHLIAMMDVQQNSLWWGVRAFRASDFSAWTIDYGTWPEQSKAYYTLPDISPSLIDVYKTDEETSIAAGVTDLLKRLLPREFPRETGARDEGRRASESESRPSPLAPRPSMLLQLVMIDIAWGRHTKMLESLIRRLQKQLGNAIMPSRGVGIGATKAPMAHWKRDPGRRFGTNWCYGPPQGNPHPVLQYDTNWWKSWNMTRLAMPIEQRGTHSLFGDSRTDHRMLADHLTAESYITAEAGGQRVDEWKNPLRRDNHAWDWHVGTAVGASYLGCKMHGDEEEVKTAKRIRKPLGELMRV